MISSFRRRTVLGQLNHLIIFSQIKLQYFLNIFPKSSTSYKNIPEQDISHSFE